MRRKREDEKEKKQTGVESSVTRIRSKGRRFFG
jgi:hypothetical protein